MRRSSRLWPLFAFGCLTALACGGDDASGGGATDPSASMTGLGPTASTTMTPTTSGTTTMSSSGTDDSETAPTGMATESPTTTSTNGTTVTPGTETDAGTGTGTGTDTDAPETESTTGEAPVTHILTVDQTLSPPALVALDIATGVGTVRCNLAPNVVVDSMEFRADDDLLIYDTTADRFLEIDPCDCGFQVVGASDVSALEFTRDESGTLHGAVPVLSAYVTINGTTGVASIAGPLGLDFTEGAVTWATNESRLLVLDAVNDQLFRYDPVAQTISNPTTVTPDITEPGLTTVAATDTVYLCSADTLYSLDTMTGSATSIGLTMMAGPCSVLAAPQAGLACD